MREDKPRLSGSAIPAGILLMLSALLCFFVLRLPNGIFDPFQVTAALVLFPTGFLLFFRRRFVAIGILLIALSLGSFAGMGHWASLDATLPVFLAHGVRAAVFLAAALVCFRRLRKKRNGAWWLASVIGTLFCIYLIVEGQGRSGSLTIGEAAIGKLCMLLALSDQVLYAGIFLLTWSFSGRPDAPAPPAPKQPDLREAEYEILPDDSGR